MSTKFYSRIQTNNEENLEIPGGSLSRTKPTTKLHNNQAHLILPHEKIRAKCYGYYDTSEEEQPKQQTSIQDNQDALPSPPQSSCSLETLPTEPKPPNKVNQTDILSTLLLHLNQPEIEPFLHTIPEAFINDKDDNFVGLFTLQVQYTLKIKLYSSKISPHISK